MLGESRRYDVRRDAGQHAVMGAPGVRHWSRFIRTRRQRRHERRACSRATHGDRGRYGESRRRGARPASEQVHAAGVRLPVGLRGLTSGWRVPCL